MNNYAIEIIEKEIVLLEKCLSEWDCLNHPDAKKDRENKLKDLKNILKIIKNNIMNTNFRVKGRKFQPGWYTLENFGYNLIFSESFAKNNPGSVNNCGLILKFFKELPIGCTVNLGCAVNECDLIIN